MSSTPNTNLQATPDFSTFQFTSEATDGFIDRLVRFSGQKGGCIYQVDFRNRLAGAKDEPAWPHSDDFSSVVMTLILIAEIYTERYPMRVLRFNPNTEIKALLFGNISNRSKYLLESLFTIKRENEKPEGNGQTIECCPFQIRRKPIAYFSAHATEHSWYGVSRIFNRQFKIELDKSV